MDVIMRNEENVYQPQLQDFMKSYAYHSKFVESLFGQLSAVSNKIIVLLKELLDKVENLEFPFVILLNKHEYMTTLTGLFYELDDYAIIIFEIIQKCIKKMEFEDRRCYSSIPEIIKFAESFFGGLSDDNSTMMQRDLSQVECIYLEYCSLLVDCNFLKSYLEEQNNQNLDENNIKDILTRISKMINGKIILLDKNYPTYILDFFQGLFSSLRIYDDYFCKLVKKDKMELTVNQPFVKFIQCDPKLRTFFFYEETISYDESLTIEYKNYNLPFNSTIIDSLKKQICGFLNSEGGRIYIGITDDKLVKGIKLTHKERDLLRNAITNYTSDFYPNCRTDKFEIVFLPIKSKLDNAFISNLWVVKVIIKQGDVDKLYSSVNKGIIAYKRMQGQCVALSAMEITDEIIKRKTNPRQAINDKEFVDPQADMPLEVNQPNKHSNNLLSNNINPKIENNVGNLKSSSNDKTGIKNKNLFILNVQGIPTIVKEDSVLRIFKDTNYVSHRVFLDDKNNCKGWAYFNYTTEEAALQAIKLTIGATIKGEKLQIKMKDK